MPRSRKLVRCRFLPYRRVRTETPSEEMLWIDVSSTAEPPFNQFSPFYPHGDIPIPGMTDGTADSVEGIWQGLKVIRGKTAPRYFHGGGRKRGGKPAGHQFGKEKRLLTLTEARRRIYIPAYEWMLEHCVDPDVLEEIHHQAFRGIPQFFYDREDNGSLEKDQPLAHAKVLVDFLNRKIEERLENSEA